MVRLMMPGYLPFQPVPYSYGYRVSDPNQGSDYSHRQKTDAAGVTSGTIPKPPLPEYLQKK